MVISTPESKKDDENMIVVPIETENDENKDDDEETEMSVIPEETPVQKINRASVIMRDGNEIQRISIVRNLPALMNEDSDECLIRLIPVVQNVLCGTGSGNAGLELHVEASQAYKDIIIVQNQRLQRAMQNEEQDGNKHTGYTNNGPCAPYTIDLGLCTQILRGIVQNLEAQDSIACSSWLDTLLEVVDHLPLCLIRSKVLPMAVQKSQQLNSIHARLTATKLFGRLTTKLEPNEIKSEIVPLVQALCQDSDAGVRASVCQQLPAVTRCMQVSELKSVILPLVIEFSKDEDEAVREANLETLAALIDSFDEDTCTQVLVPLLRKFVEDVIKTIQGNKEKGSDQEDQDTDKSRHYSYTPKSLSAVAKNYGLLCTSLEKYLDSKQKRWFVEKFCDLASLGTDDSTEEDSTNNNYSSKKMDFLTKKQDPQAMLLMCRRHAAYNFPAVVQMASGTQENVIKEFLLPQFKRLCQDSETDVRIHIAAGFHEFAKRLGDDAALLIDSFVDLVYSGEPDVISALTAHLTETLECIYGARKNAGVDDNGNVVQQTSTSFTQLTRILLACNRLIRNSSNWRCHEQLLNALACVSQFMSNDELCQSFIPMIKEEIVNARALPCRTAALRTFVKWTRDLKRQVDVNSMINYCNQTLANNRSCHKRILFLDACEMFIEYLSKQVFKEHLFDTALKMVGDPVLNIRLKCCKLLPLFKSALIPSVDTERLTALENAVKVLLNTDNQGYMGEIVKKVINELAHADAVDNVITAASNSRKSVSPPDDKQAKPTMKKKAEVAPIQLVRTTIYDSGTSQDTGKSSRSDEVKKDTTYGDSKSRLSTTGATKEDTKYSKTLSGKSEETKSKSSVRSPSPPPSTTSDTRTSTTERSPFTSTSTSTAAKKTAIVQPRQIINRSPSPRPPLNQYTSNYQKETPPKTSSISTSRTYSSSSNQSDTNTTSDTSSYKSRPPRPTGSSSLMTSSYSSTSSSSADRNGTDTESSGTNSLMKSASSSSIGLSRLSSSANERIVPIRMVDSNSSTLSDRLRPPTPVTYRRSSKDNLIDSPLTRSSSTTNASGNLNSISSTSTLSSRRPSASQVRDIPVIRTGTVSTKIDRFESTNSAASRKSATESAASGRLSSSTSDSNGLGYSRNINRSFSSFNRDSGLSTDSNNNTNSSSRISTVDTRKDYSSPSRRSTYSTLADRSPYSLTKVRSGSSLSSALGRSSNLR